MDESATSTAAQSHEPSVVEKAEPPAVEPEDEKKDVTDQTDNSVDDEPNVAEKGLDGPLDRTVSVVSTESEEYPGKMKLAIVTVALCLSVFCMALVRGSFAHALSASSLTRSYNRTTPSLQPPFLESPTSFTRLTTLVGTGARTC